MFPFLFLSCTFGIWKGWGGQDKYVQAPSGWVCKARVRMSPARRDHPHGGVWAHLLVWHSPLLLTSYQSSHAVTSCSHRETLETKEWEAWCQRKYQESGYREQNWQGFWKNSRGTSCSTLLWTDSHSWCINSTSEQSHCCPCWSRVQRHLFLSWPTPPTPPRPQGLVWRFCLLCLP